MLHKDGGVTLKRDNLQEEASLQRGIITTQVQGLLGNKDPISGARLGASS